MAELKRGRAEVSDDPAAAAAELLARAAAAGGHIALAGGSTPRRAYELAADGDADWSGATLWFGDERCVGPDHEHSNFRMAREALIDRLGPGAAPEVKRIRGELGPDEAADEYERALVETFAGDRPELDLVLLGLGPDAHCASLFPRDGALGVTDRSAAPVATPGMAPLVPRVTLTLPAVNAAREVVFLIAGEDKAAADARAFAGPPDPDAPASLVEPTSGDLLLLLDRAAAMHLEAGA